MREMDSRLTTWAILLLCVLQQTDQHTLRQSRQTTKHVPPPGIPTFRRDAVEMLPLWDQVSDRSSAYVEEFGSRSLPLRASVESIPDVIATTRRLPLRDSVEKRPPPDEAFDLDIDVSQNLDFERNSFKKTKPVEPPLKIKHNFIYFEQPQQYYVPQFYTQNVNQLQQLQNLVSSFQTSSPYRVDNQYQQLFIPGYPPRWARSLYKENPFIKTPSKIDASIDKEKKVVCYVEGIGSYRREPLSFNPEDLDPFACTHVIYAFANIDPHTYGVVPQDEAYDTVQGGYLSVTGLKRQNPDLKILISVGGTREEGTHRFANMITSANRRRHFIKTLIGFVKQYNFDGVDLHWLYPGAEELGGHPTDKAYFGLFLDEISEIFKPRNWLLVVSAPASRFRIEDGYTPDKLAGSVDFVNVQAYDFHKDRDPLADHHSPMKARPEDDDLDLFNNVEYAVRYWLKKGLPREKLVLGIPFFGRSFTLQSSNETGIGAPIKGPGREGYYTQTPGFLAYYEICDMVLNEGWRRETDAAGSPYIVNGDQWVGYDDHESIGRKMYYVKEMQLGGVFAWAADLDDFRGLCGDKWPLLNAIKRSFSEDPAHSVEAEDVPTKPYGTCDSDGLYSDRRDCSSYFICRSGFSYHLTCGSGLMFNPTNGKCDYIHPSQCRPGQTIHIPNAVKDLEKILRNEGVTDARPKVVCYLTNWAFYRKGEGKFVPEHLDQQLCSHVVYAFASLDPETLLMKEFDPWADLDNNLYSRVTSLQDNKVLLSLGGWTDSAGDKYSRLVGDGSARRKFVVGVVSFLRKHNFQGLHLDWNYPVCWQSNCKKGPANDRANFAKLAQELRKEFDKQSPPLILAAAISGYKEVIDVAYDLPALGRELDFMSVMTYDYHGSWERKTGHVSPLSERPGDQYPQYNTKYTMDYLVQNGAPKEKLIVGIPFYGQTFTLSKHDGNYDLSAPTAGPGEAGEYTKQPGMLAYYEICNRVRNQRWIQNRDPTKKSGPYAYSKDQWVGFDDPDYVYEKAKYIKNSGFGGAVAWTVDLDDFSNRCCQGAFPLLRSINRGLGRISDNSFQNNDCTKPMDPVTPPPPTLTTGVDSGASGGTTETSWTTSTTRKTTTSPWWTPESTTSKRTTTSTTTTTTTTTPRPTTSTTTTRRTTTQSWTEGTLPPSGVVMPEVEPEEPMKCDGGQYIPDPANCNAFYRCILGELKRQFCATGLHWNKDKGVCDWPSSANCKEEPMQVPPQQVPTKKPPTSTTTRRTTTTQRSTTAQPTTGSLEKCQTGQYYPHEQCNSFYVCVNGQLVSQRCAPGLHWNIEHMMCDWGYKVKCINRKKLAHETDKYAKLQEASVPYSTCEPGAFAAYAGDCSQYLICLWGKYEPFMCAPGLHWNMEKKICDWPDNAKCTEDGAAVLPPSSGTIDETTDAPVDETTKKPSSTTTTTTTEVVPQEPLEPKSGYFKIVCYFTNWAWYRRGVGKYVPEDINGDLCTHIVYGFAVLDYDKLVIKAHDSWADFDNKFYERVIAYKKKGLKVTLAIGGWNDSQGDKYSRLVNSPSARAKFIKDVIEFIEKYDFDGLDLDWEYPKCWQVDCNKGPDSDKAAFGAFVRELRAAFKPKGLLLSAAVTPSKTVIDAGYDVPALAESLDWVAVMTYDYHGQWDKKTGHVAPMYEHPDDDVSFFNANYSINYWISEGVPRRKIVMGMPLYGQSFGLETATNNGLNANAPGPGQAGEFTRAAGFLAYYEICDKIKSGWTVVKDPENRMGPYAYSGNQWVSYDDKAMIQLKSEYIRSMDLGGGMIWALDLDDFKNRCGEGKHPLLSTIRRVLSSPGTGQVGSVGTIQGENEKTTQVPPMVTESPPQIVTTTVRPETPQSTTAIVSHDSEYKVVCYFTNWAWYRQGNGKYTPSDIDPNLCTHIVYGFAVLNGDQFIIKPHDSWADFDNKFYEKVTAFKAKGIKVLIAIGGWNDSAGDKYSKLVNSPSARRIFITHVVDFVETNGFDGLDLDWEYPKCWQVDCNKGPASDKQAFADFVQELHEAFAPKGLLLSAAVSPSRRVVDAGYDVPALSKYLDWIAVMCYDYHGQWDKVTGHVAPMYALPEDSDVTFNTNFTIHYWIEQGADRKKLVLGMPMYGQSFSLADNANNGLNAPTYGGGEAGDQTRARGFLSYYEICQNIQNKGWKVVRDRKGRIGPYAYLRDQWVSFDDRSMIQHKSEYIKAMGLGGGMIWALDLDDFKNICGCESYPLLKTINRVLRNYATVSPQCILDAETAVKAPERTTKQPMKVTTKRPTEETTVYSIIDTSYFGRPCRGNLFEAHETECNAYYLCNHDVLEIQHCPGGLYWAKDHCDWPENANCHPDHTTMEPEVTKKPTTPPPTIMTTHKPSTVSSVTRPPQKDGYKVVCYFTNWAWYRQGDGKYLPSDIDADLCTHITYGFAVLDGSTLTLKPHDSWADIDNEFYTKVVAYQAKGIRVLIALGGWNDSLGDKYSRLVNSPSARAKFIENVVQFIEKWGFDGLDLDWEYPKCWQVDCNKGPSTDKQAFADFVRELRAAFSPRGWLLSAAVSPSKAVIDAGYEVASLSENFDWIAVMCYDYHGQWDKKTGHVAPLHYYPGDAYDTFNTNFTIHYWIELGADPKKLVLGMPLYGQSFTLADTSNHGLNAPSYGPGEAGEFTRAGGFLAFYEICEKVKRRSWNVVRDPEGRIGPYAYSGNQWVSYDDVSEIRKKSQMVKELGLGGGMVWALDLDDFRNRCGCGRNPLLRTMNNELRGVSLESRMENCT